MIEIEIINQKMQLLLGYIEELEEFTFLNFDEYVNSKKNKRTAERLIELIVECGSDVSGNILSVFNGTVPESYYKSFSLLGEKGIISKEFANSIAKYGGLRNRIAHEYGTYKDEIVFAQVKPLYKSFQNFYKEMDNYLRQYTKA